MQRNVGAAARSLIEDLLDLGRARAGARASSRRSTSARLARRTSPRSSGSRPAVAASRSPWTSIRAARCRRTRRRGPAAPGPGQPGLERGEVLLRRGRRPAAPGRRTGERGRGQRRRPRHRHPRGGPGQAGRALLPGLQRRRPRRSPAPGWGCGWCSRSSTTTTAPSGCPPRRGRGTTATLRLPLQRARSSPWRRLGRGTERPVRSVEDMRQADSPRCGGLDGTLGRWLRFTYLVRVRPGGRNPERKP